MSSAAVDHFIAEHHAVAGTLPGAGLDWMARQRSEALGILKDGGLPGPRDEHWKYTRTAPIEKRGFRVSRVAPEALSEAALEPFLFQDLDCRRLVFIDGRYAPELSVTEADDIKLYSLAGALERDPGFLEAYLGRYANARANGYSALNSAFMGDGAVVHIPKGSAGGQAIHLLFIATTAGDDAFTTPRNLIIADEGAEARIIESYVSLTRGSYLTNSTTELVLGENARLEHIRLQDESIQAFHVATVQAHLERDSRLLSHALSFGARLARHDINAWLNAEGAECTLNGLYMADGRQHVDFHTTVDHARPHGTSQEFYKGILGGRSRGVFNGRVHVHPDAQKTDSEQANQNLLLSRDAEVDTKPELEIYADDVKCSHGATVGQLDDDMLFYLRARGIDQATARGLLTYGFAQDIVARISLEPVRERIEEMLVSRVPEAEHLKEMG